jgi:hypothetical protein
VLKSALASLVLLVAAIGDSAAQNARTPETGRQVVLKYMGAAGWEISDGTTVILIDPYLSRINGPQPPGNPYPPTSGDTRPLYTWDDIAVPDTVAIDSHIQRADFILVTHTHYDHDLDVPSARSKVCDRDVVLVGAGASRREIHDYTGRLIRDLGFPAVVLPTHWDNFLAPYGASQQPAIDALQSFVQEVRAVSPKTKVIVPKYFEPIPLDVPVR